MTTSCTRNCEDHTLILEALGVAVQYTQKETNQLVMDSGTAHAELKAASS